MATQFGPQRTYTPGSVNVQWTTDGLTVWRGYRDSGTNIKVDKCAGQGYGAPTTVTVDTNAANTGVMLNKPIVIDPVNAKIRLLFDRNANSSTNPNVILFTSSSDNGATWSAPVTLDDGTLHGNNRFCRVGIASYNDFITVVYTSVSSSSFTSDGLYEVHSGNGGSTWSAPAKLYTSPVMAGEPNVDLGADGAVHLVWYDPGSVVNAGGPLYYARGDFNGSGWTWAASATRITPSSDVWGRSRISTSNGIVLIVGNTNWGGTVADVSTVRSSDNGATWANEVLIASHGSGPLDHPDCVINSDFAVLLWVDHSTSPDNYKAVISTDAGKTWGGAITPLTTTGNSDAPRLIASNDIVIAVGFDNVAGNGMWTVYPLFSADFAQTPIIDAFNRANENPVSDSGKWTSPNVGGASAGLKLVSNQVTRQNAAGSFDRAGSYRNDISTSGSYETYYDVVTDGGSIDLYIWDTSRNGYWIDASDGDSGVGVSIARFDAGTFVSLNSLSSFGLTSGDRLSLRLDKNCVVGLRISSGNTTEILRAADTTYRSSLRLALDVEGLAAVPVADNFGGGQLFAPVNITPPTITGVVANSGTIQSDYGIWATDAGKTPMRFTFQWQQSTDGGVTWSNITRAALRFYNIVTASGLYRVQVTGYNSFGSTTVNSNFLPGSGANLYWEMPQTAFVGAANLVVASGFNPGSM